MKMTWKLNKWQWSIQIQFESHTCAFDNHISHFHNILSAITHWPASLQKYCTYHLLICISYNLTPRLARGSLCVRASARERRESEREGERGRERGLARLLCPSVCLSVPLLSGAEKCVVLLTLCNGPCISRLSGGAH